MVITHPEPDILECEVMWALESITTNKASEGDGIPVGLFQILKDDAVKALHSMPAKIENSAVATGLEKVSFHSNPKERQCQNMPRFIYIFSIKLSLSYSLTNKIKWHKHINFIFIFINSKNHYLQLLLLGKTFHAFS